MSSKSLSELESSNRNLRGRLAIKTLRSSRNMFVSFSEQEDAQRGHDS
jgi:hypothetical protein